MDPSSVIWRILDSIQADRTSVREYDRRTTTRTERITASPLETSASANHSEAAGRRVGSPGYVTG